MIDLLGILTSQDKFAAGDPLDSRYYSDGVYMTGMRTQSGEDVGPATAMGYSAAYACTVLLSSATAMLPLNIMRRQGRKTDIAEEHPTQRLLKVAPNEHSSPVAWKMRGASEQINWNGGFFCEIERNRIGDPVALWPVHPSRVSYKVNERNRLIYEIQNDGMKPPTTIQAADMFHVPGRYIPDGIGSIGVVTLARESIGMGMATEKHGASTFGSGFRPLTAIEMKGTKLTPEARANLRREWQEVHAGGENAGKPVILDQTMELKTFQWSAEDSQFLQTRQHNVNEIARWYDVPPHMIGDLTRSTYSNIEAQGIDFVKYKLMPWLVLWEAEINRKLLTMEDHDNGYYAKFNVNGLLRGDSQARATFYNQLYNVGSLSPNEIRELEDLNPVDGGDIWQVPMNMETLDEAAQPTADPQPQPVPQDSQQQDQPPQQQNGDAKNAILMALSSRLHIVTEIEARSATKAAGDSKKFLEWMAGFYGGHVDTMRKKLGPAISLAGADTEDYVTAVVARSKETLTQIYDTAQPAEFQKQVKSYVYGCLDEVDMEAEAIYESGTR